MEEMGGVFPPPFNLALNERFSMKIPHPGCGQQGRDKVTVEQGQQEALGDI